jgi:nitronate monooxygenase
VAQGYEAGGHRGMFLSDDLAAQVGTFALVPQVVDAVKVPVIAAGGITDARGIAAAFALGAAAVQIGTAFLFTPEAKISAPHRTALREARDDGTAVTNLMTGRPARGLVNRVMREVGPVNEIAPAFPLAAGALAPLRAKAEAQGSGDFTPMWAGQAAALGRAIPAAELTRALAVEALALLRRMGKAS